MRCTGIGEGATASRQVIPVSVALALPPVLHPRRCDAAKHVNVSIGARRNSTRHEANTVRYKKGASHCLSLASSSQSPSPRAAAPHPHKPSTTTTHPPIRWPPAAWAEGGGPAAMGKNLRIKTGNRAPLLAQGVCSRSPPFCLFSLYLSLSLYVSAFARLILLPCGSIAGDVEGALRSRGGEQRPGSEPNPLSSIAPEWCSCC